MGSGVISLLISPLLRGRGSLVSVYLAPLQEKEGETGGLRGWRIVNGISRSSSEFRDADLKDKAICELAVRVVPQNSMYLPSPEARALSLAGATQHTPRVSHSPLSSRLPFFPTESLLPRARASPLSPFITESAPAPAPAPASSISIVRTIPTPTHVARPLQWLAVSSDPQSTVRLSPSLCVSLASSPPPSCCIPFRSVLRRTDSFPPGHVFGRSTKKVCRSVSRTSSSFPPFLSPDMVEFADRC